jgi:hypothetical protein
VLVIKYKHGGYLEQSDNVVFDVFHMVGDSAPYAGVYRCEACGRAVAVKKGQPLPSWDHHAHSDARGVGWRLAVWTGEYEH